MVFDFLKHNHCHENCYYGLAVIDYTIIFLPCIFSHMMTRPSIPPDNRLHRTLLRHQVDIYMYHQRDHIDHRYGIGKWLRSSDHMYLQNNDFCIRFQYNQDHKCIHPSYQSMYHVHIYHMNSYSLIQSTLEHIVLSELQSSFHFRHFHKCV